MTAPSVPSWLAVAREKHAALTVNPSIANGDFYKLARASFPAMLDVVQYASAYLGALDLDERFATRDALTAALLALTEVPRG